MTIIVDGLNDVEAWSASGGPIPLGEWITGIEAVTEEVSANKSPQLEISWRVAEGIHTGCTSREWLVVLPQTRGKVKAFLEAVGYEIPEGQFVLPTSELVGRRALTIWREDTYGGKAQIKCMGHSLVPAHVGVPVPPSIDDDAPLPF